MSDNEHVDKRRRNVRNADSMVTKHTREQAVDVMRVADTITLTHDHVETTFVEGKIKEAVLSVGGLTGEECARSLEQYGYTVTDNLLSYFKLATFERNRKKNRETATFVFVNRKELFPTLSQPEAGRSLVEINNAAQRLGLEPLSIDDGAHLAMYLRDELRNYPVYFSSYTYASLSYGAILHHNGHDLYRVKADTYFPRGGSTDVMVFRKTRL